MTTRAALAFGSKGIERDSIAMEWTIPIQTLDTSKVCISNLTKGQKPMAAFSYTDGELQFHSLSVLLPSLIVKSYDTETGKLALSLSGHQAVLNKLTDLQKIILDTTKANYRSWFSGESERSYHDIVSAFQHIVSNGAVHLYCPLVNTGSFNEIQVYSGGSWSRGCSSNLFTPGKQLRIAVRFQGISFHQHHITKVWTGKSRVQHRILAMYSE